MERTLAIIKPDAVERNLTGKILDRIENGRPPLRRPYMILLDLKMPRMDGIAFLKELRADPKLSDSVVFVLTTSNADQDKVAAYDANVAGYMLKSKVGEQFVHLLDLLDPFWRLVEFPPDRKPTPSRS